MAGSPGDDPAALVVGAGPTGLALANLLGVYGVPTLVVDRTEGPVEEPRAVSTDDEGMRLLQAMGLLEESRGTVLPGTGTRYYSARGRCLAYTRGPDHDRNGHTVKNPLDQPEFEALLRRGLERFEHVRLLPRAELTAFQPVEGAIEATLAGPDRVARTVRVRYVLGCDGGRSTVRSLAGVSMQGASLEQPWLVVDTVNDPHDQRYAMHHGDPARPYVIVPGRAERCRYEFMLLPGEDREQVTDLRFVQRLLEPHRPGTEASDIRRCTVYVFHALVAERWRVGNAFLLGDAAHMMPPFAAQGLNSGLRDAGNLAWKLAMVERWAADGALLDTYETERKPHADATVRISVRLGQIMMTRSRRGALLRDAVLRGGSLLPPVRRYLEQGRFKPTWMVRAGVVRPARNDPPLVGRLLPQPVVLRPDGGIAPLDDVLGRWFSLVEVEPQRLPASSLADPLWDQLGARHVVVRLGDRMARNRGPIEHVATLHRAAERRLAACAGKVLVVRPDRLVAAAFDRRDEVEAAAAMRRLLGDRIGASSWTIAGVNALTPR